MASVSNEQSKRALSHDSNNLSLLDILSNHLVLQQIIPHLPISSLLRIASTSRAFRELICHTQGIFRHLDLTTVKAAQFEIDAIDHGGEVWRNVQLDENVTEDDFYSGPLRGIFSSLRRSHILQDVHTLVLDGLSVTAELCHDIISDPSFPIRILSIREVKNLNERKLMQSLSFACRATRPEDTPRLKGLYVFGKKDMFALPAAEAVKGTGNGNISAAWNHKSQHALNESIRCEGDDWYDKKGRIINKVVAEEWGNTLQDCRAAIRFDAVLCNGPRHPNSPAYGSVPVREPKWSVATFALSGCAACGSAPEGCTTYGESPAEELPLLAPLPLHTSNVKSASKPSHAIGTGAKASFVPRCLDCIRERYCFSCDQWWCEACYAIPTQEELAAQHVHIVDEWSGLADHEAAAGESPKIKSKKVTQSCWDCKANCDDCIANTQKTCRSCGGGYCIVHYDGSTMTLCDWCSARGRRHRGLY